MLYYKLMQRQLSPGKLPIARYQTQIMDLIDKGPAVVISGKTGCGKSTQVPQYIVRRHPQAKVIVCQPRRVAATSLAVRVSQEMGCKLGSKVGYHIGMESFREERCSIVYMTYGILIQQLLFMENLPYSHIILDEIHERSLQMDFTFVALKKIVNTKYRQKLKLVVMSATLNAELFCDYFCSNQTGFFNIPELRQIQAPKEQGRRGRNRHQQTNEQHFEVIIAGNEFKPALRLQLQQQRFFKVEQVYLDDLNQQDFYYGQDEQRITEEMFNFGINLIKKLRAQQKDGDYLVFLPGLYQIKAMKNLLIDNEFNQKQIIEVHSLFSDQLYHSLFDPTVKNKLILATNIGQSSITLPFCRIVLDFCLSRKNYSKDRGVTRLQTRLASQASLIQRSGRVGRVSDGVVYRMITRQLYEKLSQYQKPQIQCVSLEMIILRVKQLDLMNKNQIFKNPYYFLMSTINPPNLSDIRKSLQILIHQQALIGERPHSTTVRQADCLSLTEIGKFMVEMPCDLRISKMILMGLKIRIPERIISVASILMLTKQFFLHQQRRMNMEEWMHSLVGYDRGFFNDYLLRVNLFMHWKQEFYEKAKEKKLFTRKKYIMKGQKLMQKEFFNRIYQTEQGAQDILSFLEEFNQQKWTQKQKKWCEMRGVSANSMRQLIKIQENLRLKVCAKNFKLLQKQHQSNDLILLCVEYGFPDNDCQIKWNDIAYHLKNHQDETIYYIDLPDINETSDQNIEEYIRPLKNWRIQVQKSNKTKRIYGNTSVISKFILPRHYNKGQTKNTSQLYRYLTKDNINHHFNSDITLRNRPITVLNESICKACIPFDTKRNFRLISHKFTQIGSKKMIAMGALIQEQTFFIIQLILKKKLELLLHPSGQYFCGFRTDNGVYLTQTALQQNEINAILHYRNLISQGKQTKVNSSDQMLTHEDAQKLIRLLSGNDSYTHQRENWEYRYQIDLKGEYKEQYYDINRLPLLKKQTNYIQRYRQWKMNKYTAFFNMYRPLLLENICLICKQCRNRQIVEIQQITAYDHIKSILKLNQYSGSWELSNKTNDLCCKYGHKIGAAIDEQSAKIDIRSLLLYIPFKRIEQLWHPSAWKSQEEIEDIVSQGKIAVLHAKEHLNEEECIFCFDYSLHTGEPIYKRFDKEQLGNNYVKKYMEHMRSQQHINNVVKFRRYLKWEDVKIQINHL